MINIQKKVCPNLSNWLRLGPGRRTRHLEASTSGNWIGTASKITMSLLTSDPWVVTPSDPKPDLSRDLGHWFKFYQSVSSNASRKTCCNVKAVALCGTNSCWSSATHRHRGLEATWPLRRRKSCWTEWRSRRWPRASQGPLGEGGRLLRNWDLLQLRQCQWDAQRVRFAMTKLMLMLFLWAAHIAMNGPPCFSKWRTWVEPWMAFLTAPKPCVVLKRACLELV